MSFPLDYLSESHPYLPICLVICKVGWSQSFSLAKGLSKLRRQMWLIPAFSHIPCAVSCCHCVYAFSTVIHERFAWDVLWPLSKFPRLNLLVAGTCCPPTIAMCESLQVFPWLWEKWNAVLRSHGCPGINTLVCTTWVGRDVSLWLWRCANHPKEICLRHFNAISAEVPWKVQKITLLCLKTKPQNKPTTNKRLPRAIKILNCGLISCLPFVFVEKVI